MTNIREYTSQEEREVILTLDETAQRLKISKWTVNRLIQEGKLASLKIGARRLVALADITRFIARERESEAARDR